MKSGKEEPCQISPSAVQRVAPAALRGEKPKKSAYEYKQYLQNGTSRRPTANNNCVHSLQLYSTGSYNMQWSILEISCSCAIVLAK